MAWVILQTPLPLYGSEIADTEFVTEQYINLTIYKYPFTDTSVKLFLNDMKSINFL